MSLPHQHDHSHPMPWSRTASPFKDPDAGLRELDHYQRRLPRWRHSLRKRLIPAVRWETAYIARIQKATRSSPLDSYFSMTANLGTHTFFMAALPICYWCGFPSVGMALVHMLALGVYSSGYVKDLLCLPRPLSPPTQRITMSGSAALEYGFPSTHTTNAVSVAVFCLYQLHAARDSFSPGPYHALQAACYLYAVSISLGRIYCGMHGFLDVVVGAVMGAAIAWLRVAYGTAFDQWILTGGLTHVGLVLAVLVLAVRFHPEPADNCPCFDDSVSFTGVVMGVEIGSWDFARRVAPTSAADAFDVMYACANEDVVKATTRVVGGIVIVFVWRATMKPLLLRYLPPVFRFVDHWGLRLPRRYFLQARHYKRVPPLRMDDNVLPPASEIHAMLSSLPNPRKRTVSVGPQSEADVREFIAKREANREQRRRTSRSGGRSPSSRMRQRERREAARSRAAREDDGDGDADAAAAAVDEEGDDAMSTRRTRDRISRPSLVVNASSRDLLLTPPPSDNGASSDSGREDERENAEMFSALEKPRIRYDVEVITKLVVYAGIGWLAVEGNPALFRWLGLMW